MYKPIKIKKFELEALGEFSVLHKNEHLIYSSFWN